MQKRTAALITIIVGVAAVGILWSVFARVYIDALWLNAIGYFPVFTTRVLTQVSLWLGGFFVTAAVLGANFWIAVKLSPLKFIRRIPEDPFEMPAEQVVKIAKWATVGVTLLVAAVVGKSASDQWFTFQTFLHRTPFGKVDAVFGKDIGFYVFVLPMLMYLRHYLMILTVVSALGSLGIYFAKGGLATPHYRISSRAAKHIGILVCLFLGLVAWGYWFDRFSYLFSLTGVTFGAGYADVHVRIPICWVMLLVSLAASVTILIAGFKRSATLAAATPAVFVGLQIIMWIIPGLVQTMLVSPNELDKERPFIQNNMQATREAYGLDKVEVRQFSADGKLDMATIEAEETTTKNVRLWDWRLLQATYSQIQGLRPYYQFHDVDVDRYTIEGQYQSVVLSLRELDSSHIPARARRWLGLHLMYTHGYGLCMSPVSEVTEEGNPRLIIRDIPPVTERGLKVTQPAIYFGELPANYIFVRTKQKEFDYPASPQSKYTTYGGKAGIGVSGFLRRLLFAWHFGDKNILFTDQFTPESRIVMRRQIRRRVEAIAPFLRYDRDPYPVLVGGRIIWILDAYTTTMSYPYSAYSYSRRGESYTRVNYIRNAVKVTIDAYDGTVTFYVADPEDPIIKTVQGIFPDMFVSMATEMPEELRSHIRYPLDLFDTQAAQYAVYHMTDPQVFYNKEDKWARPQETYGGRGTKSRDVESYYIIMRLPGEKEAEFLLMLPFVPTTKDNLIGWMAGRCDGDNYGKLLVYQFPKDKWLLGPKQVEALIDQTPSISEVLTLWGAKGGGSSVTRGNLLVIPIGDSLMYVEPLYIQADQGAIPQLKRVFVAYEKRVVMAETLADALATIFGKKAPTTLVQETTEPAAGTDTHTRATSAMKHYEKAMEHLKAGEWAEFGTEFDAMKKDLEALVAEEAKESP